MLILQKKKKNVELPIEIYDVHINKIKLRLLELHPEYESIINEVYQKLKRSEDLDSITIKSTPKKNLMLLTNKEILLSIELLETNWLTILGAELTITENNCKEFWDEKCEKNSKKIWFPDSINSVNKKDYLKSIQNSWFTVNQSTKSGKHFPKLHYKPVKKTEDNAIRAIRVKLNPTKEQSAIFDEWSNTTRYVYNKCLSKVKSDPKLNSNDGYKKLNKECITKKDNNIVKNEEVHNFDKSIYDWELETPKDIRNGALRDIKKAYKTAWSNIKAGNINSFGLGYRQKKSYAEQSLEIDKSAVKTIRDNSGIILGFRIYSTYMKSVIKIDKNSLNGIDFKELTHNARLKKENNIWYLCVSYDAKETFNNKVYKKTCALDPGIRKFQTIYAEDAVTSVEPNKHKIKKIYQRLDKLQTLRDNRVIRPKSYDKKRCRLQSKLSCYVDEMHYKTIAFLTKNYTSILLPSFESQDMVRSKKLNKGVKRDMMNFSFYKFKQRLEHKCSLLKHCNVTIVNEAYTSQTCGYCGNLNKTSDEVIHCSSCDRSYDRDVNGSRNIYLKYTQRI